MPLPETSTIRFTEEDAGYVTVRPVVKQTFRLPELADMVVSVTGKNAVRVQQIFRAGTVVYNGYRYRSEEHTSELQSLTNLVCRLLLEKKKKTQNKHNNKHTIEEID